MAKNIKISPSRVSAYKILSDVLINGAYSNVALNRHLLSVVDEKDRRLCTNLVYGTLKKINRLDLIISEFSKTPADQIDERVRISLLMGIYQIVYLDRVPEYALVNDSVNIVKMFVGKKAVGYTNGMLRSVLRKKNELKHRTFEAASDELFYEYGVDRNLQKVLERTMSEKELLEYARFADLAPDVTVRVNVLKTDTKELMKTLKEKGIECEKTAVPECIRINSHVNITLLDEYRNGLFSVQDMASMMVARSLDIKSGQRIYDMCAAPGGKSMHAAELAGDDCEIISADIYKNKISVMKMRAEQLGITSMKCIVQDASVMREEYRNSFDRVICDVPCSGLGVIRRKPEILHAACEEKIMELTKLQKKILSNAADCLKPGGLMTYSTCTVTGEENEDVVRAVLDERDDLELEGWTPDVNLRGADAGSGMLRIRGELNRMDSFFIARLRRTK